MTIITVSGNTLTFQGKEYACAIGKGGFSVDKREGDGCTPIGTFPLRECWYRADRLPAPQTGLPLRVITQQDGWCDDPARAEYNKHVSLPPTGGGAENLWREEPVYDLIIPLGYNDDPVIKGKGSAIFMHIAKPDYSGTEGCIALNRQDLLEILKLCDLTTHLRIIPANERSSL